MPLPGAVLALSATTGAGEAAWGFTTRAMYRGVAEANARAVAIYADEGLEAR